MVIIIIITPKTYLHNILPIPPEYRTRFHVADSGTMTERHQFLSGNPARRISSSFTHWPIIVNLL